MKDDDKTRRGQYRVATRLVRGGRAKDLTGPFVNPPVYHASTVLFDSVEAMERGNRYEYGRLGTPTSEALEGALADLEGAAGVVLLPSGLTAASVALLSCLSAGDEVIIVDCVYGPVRRFATSVLARLGITVRYVDPALGAGVEAEFTPKTKALYLEAPGSLTFEMQDVPAMAEVAHRHGATVMFDNTWATPLYFRPLDYGVDLSIMAGTKYIGGHSDVMIGIISANERAWKQVKALHVAMGLHLAPDDIYLALRGLRTLAVRLERHQASALRIAEWLGQRPEVSRVLYPPLPTDPGHALWKRDMKGACGLFGVVFREFTTAQARQFANALDLFGIGASWGGFESLVTVPQLGKVRSIKPRQAEGAMVRLHIGLEDPDDLLADLAKAFDAVNAASAAPQEQPSRQR